MGNKTENKGSRLYFEQKKFDKLHGWALVIGFLAVLFLMLVGCGLPKISELTKNGITCTATIDLPEGTRGKVEVQVRFTDCKEDGE